MYINNNNIHIHKNICFCYRYKIILSYKILHKHIFYLRSPYMYTKYNITTRNNYFVTAI